MQPDKKGRTLCTISCLIHFLSPYKQFYLTAAGAVIGLAGANALKAWLSGAIIDAAAEGAWMNTTRWVVLFIALVVLSMGMTYVYTSLSARLAAHAGCDLKNVLSKRLLQADYQQLQAVRTGDALTALNADTARICDFLATEGVQLAEQLLMVFVACVCLILIHPLLAVISFAYTPLGMLWTMKINYRMNDLYPENAELRVDALSALEQALSHIPVIKSFVMEKKTDRILQSWYDRALESDDGLEKLNRWMQPACHTTSWIPRFLLFFSGSILLMNQRITLGELMTAYYLIDYVIGPTVYFPFMLNSFNRMLASFMRVERFLEIKQTPFPEETPCDGRPSVALSEMVFSYAGEPALFRGLSLLVEGPAFVVVTGDSGCGKSTLMELMAGILLPDSGRIVRRGTSLFSPQEGFLFHGSVRDNLRMVNPDITEGEIRQICERYGADAFLDRIQAQLSGGQMQKLSLLRASLLDRDIWLLDEAASALDEAAEQVVLRELKQIAKTRLVIAAAHRKAWLDAADRIIDLGGGCL